MPPNETALALLDRADEIRAFARDIGDAGPMLPKHITSPGAAMAVVYAGAELGLSPMQSIRSLHLVEGRVVIDATTQLAMAKRAGVGVSWERSDDEEAVVVLTQGAHSYRSRYTIQMAQRAGLAGRATWQKHPDAMLRARAITAGIRAFCPEVLGGAAYAPGEIEEGTAAVDAERVVIDAEVVEAPPAPHPKPAPEHHHPDFAKAQRRFFARLGEIGVRYEDLAAYEEAHGRPRPSALDMGGIKALLDRIGSDEGRADLDEWIGKVSEVAGG